MLPFVWIPWRTHKGYIPINKLQWYSITLIDVSRVNILIHAYAEGKSVLQLCLCVGVWRYMSIWYNSTTNDIIMLQVGTPWEILGRGEYKRLGNGKLGNGWNTSWSVMGQTQFSSACSHHHQGASSKPRHEQNAQNCSGWTCKMRAIHNFEYWKSAVIAPSTEWYLVNHCLGGIILAQSVTPLHWLEPKVSLR